MADATRVPADVSLLNGQTIRLLTAVACAHGEFMYVTTTAESVLLADADVAAASLSTLGPVVSHMPNEIGDTSVASGEYADLALPGSLVRGWSDLVTGSPYFVSTNSGEICTIGDLATGDYYIPVGVAINQYDLLLVPPINYLSGTAA